MGSSLGQRVAEVPVVRIGGRGAPASRDMLAVEEPLEIRVGHGPRHARRRHSLTVTMRTPGNDVELAVGFLFAEGIVHGPQDIDGAEHCGPSAGPLHVRNLVRVDLAPGVTLDVTRLQRSFVTTSSCGLCGKASLDALPRVPPLPGSDRFIVAADVIHALPETLRREQAVFDRTGGLHAAALFDADGGLLDVREDIGRHNALDKLIGARVLVDEVPLSNHLILVSGRAGYELVQKAVAAGVPLLAAVGAPSSLARDLAHDAGMTLLGFVRDGRFNIYSGARRVRATTGRDLAAQSGVQPLPTSRSAQKRA
ncbi:MAG TPA: formate dehydrogenase accessory sulfurtransferase FdhD [Candidatus Binatia bacterium]|jgi:FdhD protein|nr:formate dehydrogenase accessory sulfurtransferase FdhD [Candidatus Binatia bacterium]